MSTTNNKDTIFDIFVTGAKKGWTLGTTSVIPNILMAFVITELLNKTGLLKVVTMVFNPIMSIFGLPGEAATVLITGWMSMAGGTGTAAKLYLDGNLSVEHLAILLPGIYLMGAQVQYMGRVLGTMGIKPKFYPIMIGISILCAGLGMLAMRVIIIFS